MTNKDEEDDLEEVLISTIDEEPDLEKGKGSRNLESQSLLRGTPSKPALSKPKSGISRHVTLPSAETFKDKVSQTVSRISGTGERASRTGEPHRSSGKDAEKRASEKGGASGGSYGSAGTSCFLLDIPTGSASMMLEIASMMYQLHLHVLLEQLMSPYFACRSISAASQRPKQFHTSCTTSKSKGPQGDELPRGPLSLATLDEGIQNTCNSARECC